LKEFNSEINVIEGVYQIKIDVPFDVKYVCTYLFKIDESYILIDAGFNYGNWDKLFFSALNEIGINIEEIKFCIISHEHLDHSGLIIKLKRKNPNMKILMHDITNDLMKWETNNTNLKDIEELARSTADQMIKYGISEKQGQRIIQFFTMWPKMRKYHEPDGILHDNDEISFNSNKLKIIWTPGHALGHVCVFDVNNKFLFSGDHVLSRISPHIGNFLINPEVTKKYENYDFNNILDLYLKSLDRIDTLNAKIIFPGHQDIIYDPKKRIGEIKQHHENRLFEIMSVIKGNPLTPFRISQMHFGEDLDEMNSYMALTEVLGHLIYLENQGRVKKIEKNGKIYFES